MTKIQQTLMSAITQQGTEWSDISAAIRSKHTIKNWMVVRNNLQGLINANLVKRYPSVEKEIYQAI